MGIKIPLVLIILLFQFGEPFQIGNKYEYIYNAESDPLGMGNITTSALVTVVPVIQQNNNVSLHQLILNSVLLKLHGKEVTKDAKEMNLPFYYEVHDKGVVERVYYSPTETIEWRDFKKAIAAVLSHQKEVWEGDEWTYGVHEQDESGLTYHNYEASRRNDTLTLKRSHQSDEPIMKRKYKHLEIHPYGHISHVRHVDEVRFHQENEEPLMVKVDDEDSNDHHATETEEKEVRLRSTGYLTLLKISDVSSEIEQTRNVLTHLVNTTLHFKTQVEDKKMLPDEAENKIRKLFLCVNRYTKRADRRRVFCLQNMLATLDAMHPNDMNTFARNFISRECIENDAHCEQDKTTLLNLLLQLGNDDAQNIIQEYVLNNVKTTSERLSNAITQFGRIEHPVHTALTSIGKYCFGLKMELHKTHSMTDIQRKACLSLGAVVSNTYHLRPHKTREVFQFIHEWMEHDMYMYNDTIIQNTFHNLESRYDIMRFIETKTVLMESISNAAIPESKHIVLKYSKPGAGHPSWRHAAVEALAKYDCQQSATALLNSSIHESDANIRLKAHSGYKGHPLRYLWDDNDHDVIRASVGDLNGTDLSRTKRSFRENLIEKLTIEMTCTMPKINWEQSHGNKEIGSKFGMISRNNVKLNLSPVESYFDVDIFTEAYVGANVNLIRRWKKNVFNAEICYQGKISFPNMNKMQDYTTNKMQELADKLDIDLEGHMDMILRSLNKTKQILGEWKLSGKSFYDFHIISVKHIGDLLLDKSSGKINIEKILDALDIDQNNIDKIIKESYSNLGSIRDNLQIAYGEAAEKIQIMSDEIIREINKELVNTFGQHMFYLKDLDRVLTGMNITTEIINDAEQFAKLFVKQLEDMNVGENKWKIGYRRTINVLVEEARRMPRVCAHLRMLVGQLLTEIASSNNIDWIRDAKLVLHGVRYFTEDIQSGGLSLYMGILDELSVSLQYHITEIEKAAEFIEDSAHHLTSSPSQAINQIVRGVNKIKQSMAILLSVNERLQEAENSFFGKPNFWEHKGEDIIKVINSLNRMILKLESNEGLPLRRSNVQASVKMWRRHNMRKENILVILADMREALFEITYESDKFKEGRERLEQAVQDTKTEFENFRVL